jgi:hypothetical protein
VAVANGFAICSCVLVLAHGGGGICFGGVCIPGALWAAPGLFGCN